METIQTIEGVIKRRRELAGAISFGRQAIETVKAKGVALVSGPQNSAVLKVPAAVMLPIMEAQHELLVLELTAIDKQLDAIGALMGAAV